MKAKTVDMLNGNLLKKIIVFAIPLMLSGMLQLLFNACDLMVVGKFAGSDSLAAVGSTGSLTALIVNLFMGISVGANVVVAIAIGRKDKEKAQHAVHTAILFSVIIGAVLSVIGIFSARFLLEKLDTNVEVLDKATLYMQIYFGGMIFNMLYNYGASILRAVGETKKPLKYLTIAGVCNVILNLIFVIVFNMDVAGVALATIISQGISAILVVRYLTKSEEYIHLNLKELRIHKDSLGEMLFVGLPAGINSSLFSISNVFIQKAVNSFNSTAVVAGNAAAANVGSFVFTAMTSFQHACTSFTSQNYGANKIENCKKSLWSSLLCVVTTGVSLGLIVIIFGKPLLNLYTDNSGAIEYGVIRLGIIGATYFLCGVNDVLVGNLRGLGYSLTPTIVSITGICVFRLVWIFTVFEANHTLEILYYSYPISWFITALVNGICLIVVYNKKKRNISINEEKSL